MPKAELPSHAKGWMVALLAAFVGFIAGFITILVCNRVLGDA